MEGRRTKILAIDDNQDNLITIKALISEAFPDAVTLTTRTGELGLHFAAAEDPDVILLDILMPEMDGFTVCRRLKADQKLREIPVVFVTAMKEDKENRIRAMECGGEAFLSKPIDSSELTAQIRAMTKIKIANNEKRDEKVRLVALVAEQTRELQKSHTATLQLLRDLQQENEIRKQSEESLRIRDEELRQSQKMESIGTLAGGIAHDFNNILAAISGYGQLTLMKMPEESPYRANITSILEAVERAAHLTKELLLFSRKQTSVKQPLNLNDVIAKTEKFLKIIIGEDVAFHVLLHQTSLPVLADAHHLEQVLMNLVTNACHSMPHGGKLTLSTELILLERELPSALGFAPSGAYALITVSDTGVGMDPSLQKKIFEPFFTTKDVGKGTGLGLAVVYGIIKEHGSYISVSSAPQRGTTFKIYLPLINAVQLNELPEEKTAMVGGTETILLAEDDKMVRDITTMILSEYGYTVITAVDGEDAVLKFQENRDTIDLLLFDLIMPKMNGKEAFSEIQKTRPEIKIIFSSGYAPETIQKKASLADNSDFITKPASPGELLGTVRTVLDRRYDCA